MEIPRHRLVLAISSLVIAGLFWSQVCDFNCTVYGCSTSSTATAHQSGDAHACCHRHNSHDTSPSPHDSRACAGHFDSIAASTTISAGSSDTLEGAVAKLSSVIILDASRVRPHLDSLNEPDRSPPPLSVLRI